MPVGGSLAPGDARELCRRVGDLLAPVGCREVACDVGDLRTVDLATIDVLARMQLTARRLGGHITLVDVPERLRGLLNLVGLAGVIEESRRQASRWSGSPNSGNQRSVSRKNVMPLIWPSDSSSTCSDQGS